MEFKPQNFRNIENPSAAAFAMVSCSKSPVVLIKKDGTVITGLMSRVFPSYSSEDLLLFAWAGNWRTDVFIVTDDFVRTWYLPKKEEDDAQEQEIKRQKEEFRQSRKRK